MIWTDPLRKMQHVSLTICDEHHTSTRTNDTKPILALMTEVNCFSKNSYLPCYANDVNLSSVWELVQYLLTKELL